MPSQILIIDPDRNWGEKISAHLAHIDCDSHLLTAPEQALEYCAQHKTDLVISEIDFPGFDGLALLEKLGQMFPQTLVLLCSHVAASERIITAFRLGVIDYVLKPVEPAELSRKIEKILQTKATLLVDRHLRRTAHSDYSFDSIIGNSPAMRNIFTLITKVANSSSNILITGKSGTGKELIARAIHKGSPRAEAPFIPINCGAIPDTLFESELFGFKKGSFTGATMDKDGVFRAANGGTLFLDEVGEIPLHTQVKLLRAIETKEIKPLGSSTALQVDVRILSATNKDLRKEIEEGNFREDLYYRLNIIEIHLPSLSERREDIPLLIEHFVRKYNQILKRRVLGVDQTTLQILMNYKWKGEVRELENLIERAVLLCEGDFITPSDLPPHIQKDLVVEYPDDLKTSVKNFERQHILSILRRVNGDKNKCAEILGIGLSSLYRKIEELNIEL